MKQENKNRKFGSTDHYHWKLTWYEGGLKWLAFTDSQRLVARKRAIDNPEDNPFAWVVKLCKEIKTLLFFKKR